MVRILIDHNFFSFSFFSLLSFSLLRQSNVLRFYFSFFLPQCLCFTKTKNMERGNTHKKKKTVRYTFEAKAFNVLESKLHIYYSY